MEAAQSVEAYMACIELTILEQIAQAQAADSRVSRRQLLIDLKAFAEFEYYLEEMLRRRWITLSDTPSLTYSLTARGQSIASHPSASDTSAAWLSAAELSSGKSPLSQHREQPINHDGTEANCEHPACVLTEHERRTLQRLADYFNTWKAHETA